METLLEIKNTYAQEKGYADWETLINYVINYTGISGRYAAIIAVEKHLNEICLRVQKEALKNLVESKNKFFRTAEMRDLEMQLAKEEISYSRMIEIINEKADGFYHSSITNPENLIQ